MGCSVAGPVMAVWQSCPSSELTHLSKICHECDVPRCADQNGESLKPCKIEEKKLFVSAVRFLRNLVLLTGAYRAGLLLQC